MISTDIKIPDPLKGNIEGSTDVQLAPLKGKDIRRSLEKKYFVKKPISFVCNFIFAYLLIALGCCGVWYGLNKSGSALSLLILMGGMLINGLLYAHLLELQHECLHHHAFRSARLNRIFGVLSGIFMFSSYSHYQYDHLRHHAYLGTERNSEHFDYRFSNLNSLAGFAAAFFDLNRYLRVLYILSSIFTGKEISGITNKDTQKRIKQEYLFCLLIFIASIAASLYFETFFFMLAWWIPTITISEGVHFLIEMPEHYGLNTQSSGNVLENSRTIQTNLIIAWFVNGNHMHTAHHFHQGVPMCQLKKLHNLIMPQIEVVEPSYLHFYSAVIRGRITNKSDATCMSR